MYSDPDGVFTSCDVVLFNPWPGNEEDHDNDRGRWSGVGGSFVHAGLPQVCPSCYPHHRVRLHTAAGCDVSVAHVNHVTVEQLPPQYVCVCVLCVCMCMT